MVYLFGASGHGLVIQDILQANGVVADYYVDDAPKTPTHGDIRVLHTDELNLEQGDQMIISIGINSNRKKVAERYQTQYLSSFHPGAIIASKCRIGGGTVIMAGAVVNPYTNIGAHCIVNTGACVDHDCRIGDFVHVAPNATVCGGVSIGEGSHIGAGSVVIQGIRIGRWCTIGAGAVVIGDVPDGAVMVGNPARLLRIESLSF